MKVREWYPARELAGLPGLPSHPRNVQKRADREGWRYREVTVRGGRRREYHVSALPEAARVELARRALAAGVPAAQDEATRAGVEAARALVTERARAAEERRRAKELGLAAFGRLPEAARRVAEAREQVLGAIDAFLAAAGYRPGSKRGIRAFCDLVRLGQVEVPGLAEALARRGRTLSYATVARWRKAYREHGLVGLAPGWRAPNAGATSLPEPMRRFVVGMMIAHPGVPVQRVVQALQARFEGQAVPPYSTVRRFMRRWAERNAGFVLYVTNPDAYRSRMQAAMGSASEQVTALNQLWEMDATPADVELRDGRRHAVIGVIDVYSRRVKFLVSRTSTAAAVAALLRRAMLDWGVPEVIKRDNGRDFCSRHVDRVLASLEIETVECPPFTPEGKPHIERAFRTMSHGLVELLPGYVGHDVAERKAIEARKSFAERLMTPGETVRLELDAQQLQRILDRWTEAMYHAAPHRGLGGRTPAEVARAWTGPVRRIADERALDLLLLPAADGHGRRVVHKSGIRVEGRTYIAPELGEHVGREVRVLVDEADLGRVYVFRMDTGAFVCVAECPEWTGISRAEVAAHARARQQALEKAWRAEKRRLLKEQRPEEVAWEILEHRERMAGKVVDLPRPAQEHTTADLAEAARAVEALGGRGPDPFADLIEELEESTRQAAASTPPPATGPQPEPAEVVEFFSDPVDAFCKLRRRPLTEAVRKRMREIWERSTPEERRAIAALARIEYTPLNEVIGL